ncbi:MAG TPA: hypothetical protein VGY58_10975 [Gemmataceae bacterium]|nr:hypothetical protein [Gemmataceae bacterium]
MQRYLPVVGTAFLLAVLAAVLLLVDLSHAASLSGKLLALALGLALTATLCVALLARNWRCLVPLGAFVIFVLILPFITLSPVKPFRGFFDSICVGMTQKEVLQQLDAYFPAGGRYAKPEWRPSVDNSLHFVLNPNDGRYDAEIVTVVFHEGGVLAKMYLPD